MKRTGPTNIELRLLISELKKQKKPIFDRLASELSRPSRNHRAVNLSRINTNTNKDEIAVVPGKVLGSGTLTKKLTIAAWQFSETAKELIKSSGSAAISLKDLMKKKGKMRIIG
jgi:large subunit ribosomal protein L18e